METRDFICACLGVASQKVDEICDNFGVDIKEDDFERIILNCANDLNRFGDSLILHLYLQIIKTAISKLSLTLSKFDYFINGADSHLYYDKQPIYGWGDLQYISIEEKQ